ncbi:hypothetical protein VNO77_04258 [Canavalia gladiata]|uniref:Uncharacterized protein n=1 Tax=Canavalia gladiata TaxID=3824 RepID=A0AAN9N1V7_CANGL
MDSRTTLLLEREVYMVITVEPTIRQRYTRVTNLDSKDLYARGNLGSPCRASMCTNTTANRTTLNKFYHKYRIKFEYPSSGFLTKNVEQSQDYSMLQESSSCKHAKEFETLPRVCEEEVCSSTTYAQASTPAIVMVFLCTRAPVVCFFFPPKNASKVSPPPPLIKSLQRKPQKLVSSFFFSEKSPSSDPPSLTSLPVF